MVLKAKREHRVTQVLQALKACQVPQDDRARLVKMEMLDHLAHRVKQVHLALQDYQDKLEHGAIVVKVVLQGLEDLQEDKEDEASQVQ